jgi:hypothetical protein
MFYRNEIKWVSDYTDVYINEIKWVSDYTDVYINEIKWVEAIILTVTFH